MSKGTIIFINHISNRFSLHWVFCTTSAIVCRKKQEAQQEQLAAAAQQVSLLVIDKKKMKLKRCRFSHRSSLTTHQKYLRRSKVPVVKAKIGPRIMTMMCDTQIYDLIPVKKEVKSYCKRYLYHRRKRYPWFT